jgi:predicted ATPase
MSGAMSRSLSFGKGSSNHSAAAAFDCSDDTLNSKDSSLASRTSTRVSHMLAMESNHHQHGDPNLPETSSQFQTRKKLKNIAMEKIKFHRSGNGNGNALYGRETETKLLASIFQEVCDGGGGDNNTTMMTNTTAQRGNDRSFTIIGGLSGMGKSALANTLKPLVHAKHGFYALGKFDASEREPLSAISQAIKSIYDQVMALSDRTLLETIRFQILDQLGSELPLLARIIPKVIKLEAEDEDARSYYPPMLDDFKEATDHFNYAIRKFLQIITAFCPIVMVMDDLQWSDSESINLIKTLITDAETKKLMIIGCFRSDLVVLDTSPISTTSNDGSAGQPNALSKLYTDVESYSVERHIHVTRLQLDTLSAHDVSLFLSDLLSTDSHKTDGLANIVLKKTGGNMISLPQFLMSLAKQELLCYNIGLNAWIWDDAKIQAESVATEDVAHLMKDRLKEVSVAAKILPIAACLGSTFSLRLLSVIMDHNNDHDDDNGGDYKEKLSDPVVPAGGGGDGPARRSKDRKSSSSEFISKAFTMVSNSLIDELFLCEEEGFIDNRCMATYAFVHDQVQEAALALLPEEEDGVVQFRIGEILLKHLEEAEVEKHLFEIVGLLNSRLDLAPQDFESKLKLARLHYRAGRKAVQISAFRSASFFFGETIKLLPEETWDKDIMFCIDLYASAAETAYCLGSFEDVVEYANRVIPISTCKPVDKLRLYVVLIETYAVWQKEIMAIDVGIDILVQLGCNFPRTKFATIAQTVKELLKTKRSVKKITPQFIDDLPVTEDPVHIGIMKILGSLMYPAYSRKPEVRVYLLRVAQAIPTEWWSRYGSLSHPVCLCVSSFS